MRVLHFITILMALSFGRQAHAEKVEIKVDLSPTGSFVAKTNQVKGQAILKGDVVTATQVEVDLNTLKTGIELRDKHLKEHLETAKYPKALLLTADGKDKAGKGMMMIRGMNMRIEGKYQIVDKELVAEFDMSLNSLKIEKVRYMGIGAKDMVHVTVRLPVTSEAAAPAKPTTKPTTVTQPAAKPAK